MVRAICRRTFFFSIINTHTHTPLLSLHFTFHRRIVLLPDGHKEGYGDHISIYLSVANKKSLADGKEVHAIYRFFLFDQIRGKYLTVQVIIRNARRFDSVKYKWGFSKFISLQEFEDPTNGFLVDGTCILGAEVYVIWSSGHVIQSPGVRECLSISNFENVTYNYKWKVTGFSELVDDHCFSDTFDVGSYKWRLCLYPKGDSDNRGCSLSFFLDLMDPPKNFSAQHVKAEYTITLNDQINKKHHIHIDTNWFGPSTWHSWGWGSFIQLKDLKDRAKKGFIVDDCCEFEARMTLFCNTHLKPLHF
ncbi:uncharacterized protein LOC141688912 [Apium graveolens]|uniref:uncharacterized protein LOC141688912 n=1 Tax=Apium graveolens TaxID=4045 RepID=UPI003D79080D